jgi:glycyl-tRNA synthetase (class II)
MMTELQNFWREFFILEENMLQIDTRTMTPEIVFMYCLHLMKTVQTLLICVQNFGPCGEV